MKISACIIAKNEEKNIVSCLESVVPYCDEVIVVDTGSSDQTVALAEAAGVKVRHYQWEGSFAKARNYSLDQATGEWVLVIDCDEVLTPESGTLLRSLALATDIMGFGVSIINIIGGSESYTTGALRFFRNFEYYRYEGIIHEGLMDLRTGQTPVGPFLTSQLEFIHYGYEYDETLQEQKTKRNMNLLLAIPEAQRDGMYYLHLGAEYVRLEDYQEAEATFERGYRITSWSAPYFANLVHKLADTKIRIKDYEGCIDLCTPVLNQFEDFKCLYFVRGICYLELGAYEEALEDLEMYQELPNKPFRYPVIPYENGNDIEGLISALRKRCDK